MVAEGGKGSVETKSVTRRSGEAKRQREKRESRERSSRVRSATIPRLGTRGFSLPKGESEEVVRADYGEEGKPGCGLEPGPFPSEEDSDGYLIYNIGDRLEKSTLCPLGRYRIVGALGAGTFGKVVECLDELEGKIVAIKIIRSLPKYTEAAKIEIKVLQHVTANDPEGWYHCVRLLRWFAFRGHVCMVFEKLGPSLYDVLRKGQFRPFSIDRIREYAWQLLECVHFLHALTLIHTDLKPENILHEDTSDSSLIKIIDFGSATFEATPHCRVVSTRHYRAPEILLGRGWTYPCDLWSVGCILTELYTGQVLYQTHDNLEHLAMMTAVLGPVPESMMTKTGHSTDKFFSCEHGRPVLNWPRRSTTRASIRAVGRTKRLEEMVGEGENQAAFLDLLKKLMAFEPSERCTSGEALGHHFFKGLKEPFPPWHTLTSDSSDTESPQSGPGVPWTFAPMTSNVEVDVGRSGELSSAAETGATASFATEVTAIAEPGGEAMRRVECRGRGTPP